MSWNIALTEIAGKAVECVITPDPNESGYTEYKFKTENPNTRPSPYVSKLELEKVTGHNNGGSISVMSVFETCPSSGGCETSDFCAFKVVDTSATGSPVVVEKQTTNKVNSEI